MDLTEGTHVLVVVHKNGQYVGWKSFTKEGNSTLYEYLQAGDNTVLGTEVIDEDTANIWMGERLVRVSSELYVNHCVQTGGSCTIYTGGSPDGDRIGSPSSVYGDNSGGGLGNWHDMGSCCNDDGYGNVSCDGDSFQTTIN